MKLTEEEKDSIGYLQYLLDYGCITDEDVMHFKNILNLIEKLQKENEDREQAHMKLYNEFRQYKDWDSIPKDKIRQKIEELNNYYKKEIYPTKYQWADIDITEFYDSQIDLLEDLLK